MSAAGREMGRHLVPGYLRRRALPVVGAVVFAVVPSLACGASAASKPGVLGTPIAAAPGWRVTEFLAHVDVEGLSASGRSNAWLAGDICGADSLCNRVLVRHWDGTAWRTVPLPKLVKATAGENGIGAVAASSPSSAWVFDQRGPADLSYTTALHWTGKRWAPPARLAAGVDAAVSPSASDAWAFGYPASDPDAGYVAHFNGKSWRQATFPVQVQTASALSARDIWIGGSASDVTDASVVIEHWNGKAWHRTPVPGLSLPQYDWTGVVIAAEAPRDVWANVGVLGNLTRHSYLLHWNGTAWAKVTVSCPGDAIGAVAPDGEGGVWLDAYSTASEPGPEQLCHEAKGHWTAADVPKRNGQQPGVHALAWIPGTRSLWASAGFEADEGEAVLKYGP